MRTTLTIDDDIAKLVQDEVRRSGGTLKGTVNRLLRDGLMKNHRKTAQKPFVVTPLPLGLPPGLSYDCTADLLDALEGPMHK